MRKWSIAALVFGALGVAGVLFLNAPGPSFEAKALAIDARPLTEAEELTQRPLSAPILRCQQAPCSAFYLQYEVLVDESGRPVAMVRGDVIGEADRELQAQADAYVRTLRYPPLSPPAAVRMWQDLEVYPPVRLPARHVALPVYEPSSVRITLERTGCFGSCPAYTVSIDGDGSVLFDGRAYVAETGRRRSAVDPAAVRGLYEQFRSANFMSLDDSYVTDITDNPTYTLTIESAGARKTVIDYVGAKAGMPDSVTALEDAVDRVANTDQWIGPPQPW